MPLMLSLNEVQSLDKESLFQFLAIKLPEGAQIDYKENISGDNPDKAHKEFLKDITAFANAHGGLLFFGVKEPSEDSSPQTQALGIPDGDNIAKTLERVAASCVDPRIPGLLIKPVQIENNKHVIVIYIPASLIRPHMVSHQKHRSFYVRHSESSVPMSTHEIRDTVLGSATTEARARAYAQEEEIESLEYTIGEQPAFLLQAVPLLSLESPWDVLSRPIENIMRGEDRSNKYEYNHYNLKSGLKPTPTLKGVKERDSRENQTWLTEVHRSGFIQAIYLDVQRVPDDRSKFALHDAYVDLFRAFCDLCESLWEATQTDMPYLFRCKYYNAEQTVCFLNRVNRTTNTYGKRVISLPEQLRQTGESINEIPRLWGERLFNAFGLDWKVPNKTTT